jgi:hypothetical protein
MIGFGTAITESSPRPQKLHVNTARLPDNVRAHRLLDEVAGQNMDRTKFALVVLCLGLAGLVVWQQSADQAMAVPPKPLQLIERRAAPARKPAATPAPTVTPVAPAVKAARDAVSKPIPATRKPVPRRQVEREIPAVVAASRSGVAAPSPAPPVAPAPKTAPSYERTLAEAAALGAEDVRAVRKLEQLIADEPARAEAYESLAAIRLRQGDYYQAGELLESAMRNGGSASFAIVHDHSKGNFEKDPKASCVGELILSPGEIKFAGAGAGESHHFEAAWTEVLDAGSNRFFGSGMGGFHVAINVEGKYKNFNLAPKSKDKSEAKLIVEMLNGNARKTDRGK